VDSVSAWEVRIVAETQCEWCKGDLTGNQTRWCSKVCNTAGHKAARHAEVVRQTGHPPLSSNNAQGAVSELRVVVDLMLRGYMVFRNVSPRGSTDLIGLLEGPNQTPLRFEVKTVLHFNHAHSGKYNQGEYFDHWASVKYNGEIQYDPPLPGERT
jgi:hypothetical protein